MEEQYNFNIEIPYKEEVTSEENKSIEAAFQHMCASIRGEVKDEDLAQIRRAYLLGRWAHGQQRRKSGEPYILHPIEVARICASELDLGTNSIIAALLHDVVEDTPVTLDFLEEEFGQRTAMIVDGLTKFSSLSSVQSRDIASPQAENFKKILLTISQDIRVVLIKMADRLHNMRTLGAMPHHKQLKIASETSYIYAPLAHRFGFYTIKTELEDLCMKIIEPEQYEYITQKLEKTEDERATYIQSFIAPIQKSLDEEGYDNFEIFGRAKSISSISNKLKKKQVPFEEIYDLFAIRIILDVPLNKEKAACWNIYSIITDHYTPIPERLKDWVSTPKSNGYESLHTTVMGPKGRFVEIQIRTKRMNEIAELGFAAHWRYKGVKQQENVFEAWLNKARELLEAPDDDAIDFLNDFKSNLFAEEVYVFTPKGEMRFFPKGATALDFAFDIHSEVGYHCKSVKVAERIVPLSYELRNGDQLFVITSPNQKPTESWLKIVQTGRAKSKIRQAIREEKMQQGSIGKEMLFRKLKSLKLLNPTLNEENIDALAKYYGIKKRLDFYYAIYKEQLNLNEIKLLRTENGKIFPERIDDITEKTISAEDIPISIPLSKRRQFTGKPKLLINDVDASNFVYSLATCCNPVLGDDIFAYVTSKHGLKIHRTTCPNAEFLQATFGYRIKKAEWIDTANTSFVAELLITGMDDLGVVQNLSDIITNKLKVNMRSFSMVGKEGHFEGRISVVVTNKDELNHLMIELKKLEEVNTIARIQ